MTMLGEILGFGLVGALAAFVFSGEEPGTLSTIGFSIAAAVLEGGVLAYAQWRALRRVVQMGYAAWAFATIWPAIIAYLVGMLLVPRLWDVGLPSWAVVMVGLGMLVGIGALLGLGQWFALRTRARRVDAWVPWSAVAWAGGVALAVAGVSLSSEAPALWVTVVGAVVSGCAMGAFVGLVTSVAFVHIEPLERDR